MTGPTIIKTNIRPEHRIRGGRKSSGHGLSGYVRVSEREFGYTVSWRWRDSTRWRSGSVRTREEAEALRRDIREMLARGEEPTDLPTYDSRLDPARKEALAERDAGPRPKIDLDAERCPHCLLMKPCDPCIVDLKQEMRSARRERV